MVHCSSRTQISANCNLHLPKADLPKTLSRHSKTWATQSQRKCKKSMCQWRNGLITVQSMESDTFWVTIRMECFSTTAQKYCIWVRRNFTTLRRCNGRIFTRSITSRSTPINSRRKFLSSYTSKGIFPMKTKICSRLQLPKIHRG